MNFRRIIKFQFVAWIGTLVNMCVLWVLKGLLDVPLMIAGACAIELAIIHNFTWHYFLTWRERVHYTVRDYFLRLLKYNLVTASIDFVLNLTVLYVLTKYFGVYYLVANLFGMLAGPILKFLANEFFIFRHKAPIDGQA
jgi:dolichol-phosphate mannosyltransferase